MKPFSLKITHRADLKLTSPLWIALLHLTLDYFTSSNDYSGYATEAENRVSSANNASFTDTDKAGYAAIRNAMSADVRKKYDNAIENNGAAYTPESWANFKAIYEKCKEIMAKVNDSGSNYESGKPYSTSEAELGAMGTKFNRSCTCG